MVLSGSPMLISDRRMAVLSVLSVMVMSTLAIPLSAQGKLLVGSVTAAAGAIAEVEIRFESPKQDVAALAFRVEYDETRLRLSSPGDVLFHLPGELRGSVVLAERDGAIGISVYNVRTPITSIPRGTLVTLRFRVQPGADGYAAVRIPKTVPPSASDARENRVSISVSDLPTSGVTITPARADLSVSPAQLVFGSVPPGQSVSRTVVISNSGNQDVSLLSIELEGSAEFRLSSLALPLILRPGASVEVTVTFVPAAPGSFTGRITVETSSPIQPAILIPLTGSVTPEGSFTYEIRSLLPAAARVAGANGSVWRTSLTIFNGDFLPASVRLTFLNPASTRRVATISVGPGQSKQFDDVLAELFQLESDGGAIRIEASSSLLTFRSTTYNLQSNGGRISQPVPIVDWSDLVHTGEPAVLTDLERTANRRSSLTLLNLSQQQIVLRLELRTETGAVLGTRDYLLQPDSTMSNLDLFEFLGVTDAKHLIAVVRSQTPDATYFGYASTVDYRTGSALFQPLR